MFLKATTTALAARTSALNEARWTSDGYTLQVQIGSTAVLYDVPLLQVPASTNTVGWGFNIKETTAGSDPKAGSVVAVEVSLNGQDWSTNDNHFAYTQIPIVESLFPVQGPTRGGTQIVITGRNFIRSSSLSCHFGLGSDMIVPVSNFINSTRIVCVSPGTMYSSRVILRVTNNGVLEDNDFADSGPVYSYDKEMIITSVIPPAGPISGNFSVHISGGPFNDTSSLLCKFGDVVSQAFFVSSGMIECHAPSHAPGIYPIEVSNNGQDFSTRRVPFFVLQRSFA